MSWLEIDAEEIMVKRGGSVNPSKFPNEIFDLLSIPAYDKNEIDVLKGSEIGSSKSCVQENDVLLSKIIPHIRRCWVVPKSNGKRQIGSGEWIIFRSSKYDPDFLRHFLTSNAFHQQFMNTVAGMGGSLVRARPEAVKKIKIPLPPLEEQKRIATILDKADALRRKRQKAIDLTDQLLRSVFLDMFGDPVTNPKGWEEQPFGSIVENCDSMRVPVKEADRDLRHGEYPYYGSVGVIDYMDDYLFDGEYLLISEDGKHLESRTRPIACIANGKFWVNNHAHVVKFNGKSDMIFLAHFMEMVPIQKYITGIDQIKLNRKSLDRLPVPVPPIELQSKFREVVRKIEKKKEKMNGAVAKLDNLFSGLSQQAFRGELTKQTEAA